MDTFFQKFFGEVIAFALNVLRQGNADRAGTRRIGQHAHRVEHGAHQLFGTGDSVPIAANGFVSVVGGCRKGVHLFKLLKHGVGLAGGKRIRREQKQRNLVDRCGCRRGNHIGSARTDRRGTGNDFAAVILLCKGGSGVRHALFIFALENRQSPAVRVERFTEAADNSVAENGEDAFHEFGFFSVEGDILVI